MTSTCYAGCNSPNMKSMAACRATCSSISSADDPCGTSTTSTPCSPSTAAAATRERHNDQMLAMMQRVEDEEWSAGMPSEGESLDG